MSTHDSGALVQGHGSWGEGYHDSRRNPYVLGQAGTLGDDHMGADSGHRPKHRPLASPRQPGGNHIANPAANSIAARDANTNLQDVLRRSSRIHSTQKPLSNPDATPASSGFAQSPNRPSPERQALSPISFSGKGGRGRGLSQGRDRSLDYSPFAKSPVYERTSPFGQEESGPLRQDQDRQSSAVQS